MDQIRIVVASDAPLLLLGLGTILRQHHQLAVVAEVPEVPAAVASARRLACDVLLIHHTATPSLTATRVMEQFSADARTPRVLLLTDHSSREELLTALRIGIQGYAVLTDLTADELCNGVVTLARHGVWTCPGSTRHLLSAALRDGVSVGRPEALVLTTVKSSQPALSERELGVLRRAAAGQREAQIAHDLCLSPNTVKTYLRRIGDKLQTHSRADAIQAGIYLGLVADRRGSSNSRQTLRPKVVS